MSGDQGVFAGLVAASPGEPVCGMPAGAGTGEHAGEQAFYLGDGERIMPAPGGAWPRVTGGMAWASVRFFSWAAVTAQIVLARAFLAGRGHAARPGLRREERGDLPAYLPIT